MTGKMTDDSTNTASSHSSAAYAVSVASASTSSDNFCDICWINQRARIILCLFRVAMNVSAIRVPVNCLLLPRHVASADNKLTC